MKTKTFLNLLANDLHVTPSALAQVYDDYHANAINRPEPKRRLFARWHKRHDGKLTATWSN